MDFFHIDEANDGHTAIVEIKNKKTPYGKKSPYDLVLCDLNMPTISGLDVLKIIKKDSSFTAMPFIMITGLMDKENLLEAVRLGVSDYVAKPFEEADLLSKIDKVLL
jgi:CheY-like chemotaxis protein